MPAAQHTLSERGQSLIGKPLRADFALFDDAAQNAFDATENPDGAISLCIAENVLSWPEMRTKLHHLASAKTPPDWVAKYSDIKGSPTLREALAGFAERQISTLGNKAAQTLKADNFAVTSGATGIVELTAMLLADTNDVAILPAPNYQGYKPDLELKAGLERYYIELDGWEETPGIHPLRLEDLDGARAEILAQGKQLSMVILTQPDNPTGAIFTATQLENFADWAIENRVHLCVNEIYALSQVDTSDPRLAADYGHQVPDYGSFLHLIEARQSPYLHWWYSFSKDFGISGLRCGVLYSRNSDLIEAFGNFGAPHTVSNHTQWLLAEMLNDDAWVSAFAKTNQERLTNSYATVIEALRQNNIEYRTARGSLFVWAKLNPDNSVDDETFWRKLYDNHKVLLTAPGGYGSTTSGWFRMVYSSENVQALEEALRRIFS